MSVEEFTKQQYLTLRDEIREAKARLFWLLIAGVALILLAGYLAEEYKNGFANASVPFLVLVLMLAYMVEQNTVIRAGRYLRENVEPRIQGITGWEHWLESNTRLREVDRVFFAGFLVIFLLFYAVATGVALDNVSMQWMPSRMWYLGAAYGLAGLGFIVILARHWHSCTTTKG